LTSACPDIQHQVAGIMRRLYDRRLTTSSGGNVSARDERGTLWITPAGLDKSVLRAADIVAVETDGAAQDGGRPSSELPLHTAVERARPDAGAIVHAHSPALVAFSVCHETPELSRLPRAEAFCGPLAYVPYAEAGSDELGRRAVEALGRDARCAILENHGAFTLGATLTEAFLRYKCLEHAANALLLARALERLPTPDPTHPKPAERPPSRPENASHEQLCRFARRASERGLVSGPTGSFSARVGDEILATPPDADLEAVEPDALVRAAGLHQAIYATHPEVGAVVDAAPACATAFGLSGRALATHTIPESWIVLGESVTIPAERADDERHVAASISPRCPTLVLARRGVVATGRTLAEAFDRLEVLEATAETLLHSCSFGTPVLLDRRALDALG
jgi:L-fuculose-phosphate aldolase